MIINNNTKSRKEGVHVRASLGSLVKVRGETARKMLSELDNPNANKDVLNNCSILAQEFKTETAGHSIGIRKLGKVSQSRGQRR